MQVAHVLSNIQRIDAQTWSDCCCHVQAKESEYWKTDIAVEDEIEQIIIQIDPDTDVSSDEEYNVVEDTADMNAEIRQEEKPLTPPERRPRP